MHSHTMFSGDSTTTPDEIEAAVVAAGLDVQGKTVVMRVNDPGFHANDARLFGGKRMTYYGRWTYKFEEAARKGAAGA